MLSPSRVATMSYLLTQRCDHGYLPREVAPYTRSVVLSLRGSRPLLSHLRVTCYRTLVHDYHTSRRGSRTLSPPRSRPWYHIQEDEMVRPRGLHGYHTSRDAHRVSTLSRTCSHLQRSRP
ncbi:hypothetical protein AVEN_169747-1 [Araneus ventricosus]|uniref:Uncharacterized protein n=1 Tax=Araneus ventricosus TaxID=182803 RepID=A0A4Y2N2Z2_ARAVE|nr:hypothetical protein AVEN_169747-1 [Araneus ventricosus]